jgi:hypothetical protein
MRPFWTPRRGTWGYWRPNQWGHKAGLTLQKHDARATQSSTVKANV